MAVDPWPMVFKRSANSFKPRHFYWFQIEKKHLFSMVHIKYLSVVRANVYNVICLSRKYLFDKCIIIYSASFTNFKQALKTIIFVTNYYSVACNYSWTCTCCFSHFIKCNFSRVKTPGGNMSSESLDVRIFYYMCNITLLLYVLLCTFYIMSFYYCICWRSHIFFSLGHSKIILWMTDSPLRFYCDWNFS